MNAPAQECETLWFSSVMPPADFGRSRGGPLSAWLWVWESCALRSRIFHVCDEPSLASSYGAAWDAPRSRWGFRPSYPTG